VEKRNSLIKISDFDLLRWSLFNFHCHVQHNCNLERRVTRDCWLTFRVSRTESRNLRTWQFVKSPSINSRWRARTRFPFRVERRRCAMCACTYLSTCQRRLRTSPSLPGACDSARALSWKKVPCRSLFSMRWFTPIIAYRRRPSRIGDVRRMLEVSSGYVRVL